MNKKILAAIAAGLICVFAVGCGTTYQKALNEPTNKNYGNGYFTSKLIKKLEQEKGILTDKISKMSTFIVAITENYDQIKAEQEAEFNLNETISQIDEIDKKIITIRHAKSVFNNSVVMKNGFTVGDNIIRLAILEREKSIYSRLATRQKKIRNTSINKDIEYTYLNYDLEDAKKKYDSVYTEISEIQEELNIVNSSAEYKFEIDIDL